MMRVSSIEKYLQKYSSHPDVTLSNDICVVIDVLNSYKDCYKYMKLPEYERDYSNAPFKNVMQYIDDLNDMHKLETLLSEVDRDLFIEAVEDYKRMNNL